MPFAPRRSGRRPAVLVSLFAVLISACISSEVDPRCTITSPPEYRDIVAQCVNASEFWQAYFDALEPGAPGQPLIGFELHMERRVTGRSDGDYDPGWVKVRFTVTDLQSRWRLYEREAEVQLDEVIFGNFGPNPTREEIQQRAFEATESKIYPHVEIWTNVAALRAMGRQKAHAETFVPILEEAADNPWGEDIPDEANTALARLRGRR